MDAKLQVNASPLVIIECSNNNSVQYVPGNALRAEKQLEKMI